MGKKSKRRTGKKDGNGASSSSSRATPATGRLTPASLATSVVPHLSDSSFANPFEGEPTPGTGWARELRHAEHELKDDGYRDDGIVLRAAKAACAMRQFDRLGKIIGKAELKGVTIDGAENYALMRSFRDAVEKHNGRSTGVNDPQIKALLKKAEKEEQGTEASRRGKGSRKARRGPGKEERKEKGEMEESQFCRAFLAGDPAGSGNRHAARSKSDWKAQA